MRRKELEMTDRSEVEVWSYPGFVEGRFDHGSRWVGLLLRGQRAQFALLGQVDPPARVQIQDRIAVLVLPDSPVRIDDRIRIFLQ